MCNCGCNTCETKGPLLTEGKVKSLLSEGLQYHIDKKIPLFETVYRIGSKKHLSLIKEARKMYSRNVIDLCEEDEALIGTNLGEFALYEGESVPLDLPMLEENQESPKFKIGDFVQPIEGATSYLLDKPRGNISSKYVGQIGDVYINKPENLEMKDGEYVYSVDKLNHRGKMAMSFDFKESDLELISDSTDYIRSLKPYRGLNESYDYDEVAQSEFGMDYDQLGSGEKEWVRDEIDNMSMNEDRKYNQEELLRLDLIARRKFDCDYEKCTDEQKGEILKDKVKVGVEEALQEKLKGIDGKACWKGYKLSGTKKKGGKTVDNCVPMKEAKQDIYDKFLDNPSSPKGRAKSLILKFTKEYGDDASSMAVDRFASKNNLKPEEKYILKYITKNDIKISSQSGGPDFSAVSEAEFKGKEVALNKPKRGGPKAYYVYVKDGDKVKKVTFGSGGLRAKIKNKEARNAFAARHNCKDKKDRTKAGYWSCNLPRYAPALGLGAKMNTFW